jgi:citrate lyase subunit beta/citryl-CoA lyase
MSADITLDQETSKLIPLRSLLFVPGNRESMLEKATGAKPDAFVLDLEDSVPPDEKLNARVSVERALPTFAQTGIPVIPRLNGVDSEWLEADIEATVSPHVYGVSIGKIRTPTDILHIDELLLRAERDANLDEGRIRLVPWIETAQAVLECFQICTASSRIVAIAFGAEDLTLDMGIQRSTDDSEVSVPRSLTCLAAAAAGLPALDTPFFAFRDPEALERNAEASKKVGFRGKFAIHPAQIDTINSVFSPSEDEITEARRIVEAFDSAAQMGRGSTSLDGMVVDVPVVARARALLQRAGTHTD